MCCQDQDVSNKRRYKDGPCDRFTHDEKFGSSERTPKFREILHTSLECHDVESEHGKRKTQNGNLEKQQNKGSDETVLIVLLNKIQQFHNKERNHRYGNDHVKRKHVLLDRTFLGLLLTKESERLIKIRGR